MRKHRDVPCRYCKRLLSEIDGQLYNSCQLWVQAMRRQRPLLKGFPIFESLNNKITATCVEIFSDMVHKGYKL